MGTIAHSGQDGAQLTQIEREKCNAHFFNISFNQPIIFIKGKDKIFLNPSKTDRRSDNIFYSHTCYPVHNAPGLRDRVLPV